MKPTNDLFLRALAGEKTERPPVWMMRQAGRYLPDFMALKAKYPFFDRVQNPELAAEITVMPIDQVGVDAAILFSDILVIPQAMGQEVQMITGKGPVIPDPIRKMSDLDKLHLPDAEEALSYVMGAIKETLDRLDNRVPLIGFAGSPWTLFCYMVEGGGSKDFSLAKSLAYQNPKLAHKLLQMITDLTIDYLKAKVKSGVHAVQVFDSWGGLLGPDDYSIYSLPYIEQIVEGLKDESPVIVFAKGCWYAMDDLKATGASALGVDWTLKPELARKMAGPGTVLQGNFDPSRLLAPIPQIEAWVDEMIQGFGPDHLIANLGHGILPHVPVDHAKAFVNRVKAWKA